MFSVRRKNQGYQYTAVLNNIYGQLIDDSNGKTLASASSLSKEIAEDLKSAKNKSAKSKLVGNLLQRKH